MKRSSGVLMHLSSLFGKYSSGSFGAEAKYFIDFLAESGFSYWQVLPFCMPDEFNSPYKSYSSFGANPWFIDLPTLYEKGLLSYEELRKAEQASPYAVEYSRLEERISLLYLAASRIRDRSEIERGLHEYPELSRAALFLALRRANGGAPWQEWTVDTPDSEVLFFEKFIQYEFLSEWRAIKEYANSKGIKIIGDVPIYVSLESADVYFHREEFLLDSEGYPTEVAGVPPDYFSKDGQLWGNPLYDYRKMKENGYSWWRTRIGYMFELFDGVRLDHFRGFEAYWSIPAGAVSASLGKWVKGPGRELIRAIRDAACGGLVIAEDLGDITPGVEALVKYSGFPGMRVFQFAFLGDSNSTHLPYKYPENAVAYTGTHDNNTLLGYIWEMPSDLRRLVFDYIGQEGEDFSAGVVGIIRTVLSSHSGLAVIPIQDLLGYGSDTRMNTPGRAEGNWTYRLTKDQLDKIDRLALKKMNLLYGR